MTDRSDNRVTLRDEIADSIRPVIQGHIARAYGIDDLGALVQEAAQAAIDALGFTDLTEFERLMLVDILRITREQAEKFKRGDDDSS